MADFFRDFLGPLLVGANQSTQQLLLNSLRNRQAGQLEDRRSANIAKRQKAQQDEQVRTGLMEALALLAKDPTTLDLQPFAPEVGPLMPTSQTPEDLPGFVDTPGQDTRTSVLDTGQERPVDAEGFELEDTALLDREPAIEVPKGAPLSIPELFQKLARARKEFVEREQKLEEQKLLREAIKNDPGLQLQVKLALEAAKDGVDVYDPATGRILHPNEITSGIRSRDEFLADRDERERLERVKRAHKNSMLQISRRAVLQDANTKSAKILQNILEKDLANHKAELKESESYQYRWGNISSGVKNKIHALGDIKVILNLINENLDEFLGAFGKGDRTDDYWDRIWGGEGAAEANALLAQLRTSILFGRGGKALTEIEIAELSPMVPEKGIIWGDNDLEAKAKLRAIDKVIFNAVKAWISGELREGKKFDTSILNDLGWSDEEIKEMKIPLSPFVPRRSGERPQSQDSLYLEELDASIDEEEG